MSGLELCLIGVAALFGSAIAAIAGLGGGILLMAVLLQFLDPLEVVPIHGVIQLASNSSRAVILRDDVDWDGDTPVKVKRMTISLTWDHRVLDGAPAAEFGATIKSFLEQPLRLLA